MVNSYQEYVFLFAEVIETTRRLGVKKTAEILQNLRNDKAVAENPHVYLVTDAVSRHFNIPVSEILFGHGRKNYRAKAIGFCAYYLNDHFSMDMMEVVRALNTNRDSAYTYMREIVNLNPGHVADQKFIEIKKLLDREIIHNNNPIS